MKLSESSPLPFLPPAATVPGLRPLAASSSLLELDIVIELPAFDDVAVLCRSCADDVDWWTADVDTDAPDASRRSAWCLGFH